MHVHVETPHSRCWSIPTYLSPEESAALLANCRTLDLAHHPQGKVYGKPVTFHRDIGFFSDSSAGYAYSGQLAQAQPMPLFLQEILAKVNETCHTLFNGWLVNRYMSGAEYIGPIPMTNADLVTVQWP